MKILHTGDWHIGKLVHGVHMTLDQHYLLKQLIELIKKEQPEVLLIAGDVYDRSIPPIEAVELLDTTLSEIILQQNIKVMAIAGNHDSPDRVGFASKLLRDKGLFISGNVTAQIDPIILEDKNGPINFYLIPYAEPALVREMYGDDEIKSHDLAMKAITSKIESKMDKASRSVCLAHAYLMGVDNDSISESVRPLSIGGSEYVDPSHFDAFDYVALGHLHKPQKVKRDTIRYSGSLLKYSFSEATQHKSVTMIDLNHKDDIGITLHELQPLRDLRVIKGSLEQLMEAASLELNIDSGKHTSDIADNAISSGLDDYIMAILTDKGELIDPISTLRTVYPNVLRVEKETYEREAGEDKTSASADFKKKDPLNLFAEFYENISREEFDESKSHIVSQVINRLNLKERVK